MIRYGIRYLIVLLMCALAGSVEAYSQTDVPLPELEAKRLLNNLQITVAPTPYLGDSMAIGLVVRYGSAFDGENKGGLANLLSRMFLKATVDKTEQDIREELEYLGATLEVRCNWDGFQFLLKGNSATFERALLLLYQIVCEARFPEEELAAVKQEILKELQLPTDPRSHLHDVFEVVLFGNTTYGRNLKGTPETVQSLTAGDLRYFYGRHFSPNAASLIITGDVDPSIVFEKASRIWGLWVRKDPIPFTFAPARKAVADVYLIEDDPASSAVEFIMGNFSPRRQDPLFSDATLATHILQQRLRKLFPTSLLTVGLDGRRMPGDIYIQGQAAADDAVDQILKIQEALETMRTALVSAEELAQAQNRLVEEFRTRLTSPDGLCKVLLDIELYRLGSHYLSAFADYIRSCDADSVRQAARDSFSPGKKIVILRGAVKSLLPELKRLGPFRQIAP